MTAIHGGENSETLALAEWLASRSDEALVELLRLRPDLTVPLPASMTVLAGRAEQRASVLRAADEFGTVVFGVIEALAIAGATTAPVPVERVYETLGDRLPRKAIDGALDLLRAHAMVWGADDLRLVPAVADAVPWPLGRSVEPVEALSAEQIDAALAQVGPTERALLERLSTTAPIGRTRDAAPGTPSDRPVQRLLALGLLRWVDEQTVELPHEVGQVLRGEPITDPTSLTAPRVVPVKYKIAEVNGAAAGEALELLRHCTDVLDALGESPAPALRAGGMGVRELRRVAKATGVDEQRMSLVVEVLAAAGLIGSGMPDPAPLTDTADEFWAPTTTADPWREASTARRWAVLAAAWLALPRRPWLIGMRDSADKPIAALSDEARSAGAPRDRRLVLSVLDDLGTGEAIDADDVLRLLVWRRPRWVGRLSRYMVAGTLREAAAMGLLGRGALSSPGRALLHGGDEEAEMRAALPAPIDYVLVQADLTVVAPGPLTPELQRSISLAADLESAGAAAVYRVGEASVRRALDAGMTGAELHALFGTHSRTPVPQSLTYLIDDVARRHGRLRAGIAASFVRSEDPALLAEVLASPVADDLAMRALAPTVAISQASLADVLDRLRTAGFAPVGENAAGTIVDLRPHGARISVRRPRAQLRMPQPPNDEQLANLVRELRAGDRAAKAPGADGVRPDGTRATGAATVALLQLAVRARRSVRIGYIDAHGTASHRIVEPVKVGGGTLDAFDPTTGAIRHFTLHRIASVALVD